MQAWQRRPQRERLLIAAVLLALLAALVDALWTGPLERRLQRVRSEHTALQDQLQALQDSQRNRAAAQPQWREQEAALRQRLQAAQAASQALRQRAGDAARLPETLRAITATVGSAQLLALSLAGDVEPAAAAATADGPRLYRLPIALKVSARYDELQHLLTQIEQQAQALQWSSVSLDNSQWPAIQLTLKAHVLSLHPRWGAA